LSGPLRDRFDLALEIPALPWSDMRAGAPAESSEQVRSRVVEARNRQIARQGCTNARLDGKAFGRICRLDDTKAESLLGRAVAKFQLSARSVTRVLRVARTLADLEGQERVGTAHVAEAVQFRLPEPAT
jgi:magnesium chelatase family protein